MRTMLSAIFASCLLALSSPVSAQTETPGRTAYVNAEQLSNAGREREARIAWAKACELDYAQACWKAAVAFNTGTGGPLNRNQAFSFGQQGCDLGHIESCVEMAAFYSEGTVVEENAQLAAKHFKAGCDIAVPVACANLAILHGQGRGVERDLDLSYVFTRKACDLGLPKYCDTQKRMESSGRLSIDMTKSAPARDTLFCENGVAVGCSNLAIMHGTGSDGYPVNVGKAKDFLLKACDLGWGEACQFSGNFYHHGANGFAQSDALSVSQWVRACQLDAGGACSVMGDNHRDGTGVMKDMSIALGYYERACELDNGHSCLQVGSHNARTKEGMLDGWPRTAYFLTKSCNLGNKTGCSTFADLSRIKSDYERDVAAIRARYEEQAAEARRQRLADHERRRQAAMRGVGTPSGGEKRVCAMIYQGGRATYQCMSESHFDRYYRP